MSKKATAEHKAFPGQHEGEEVELVFHQHPLVMRKQLIVGLLILLAGALQLLAFTTWAIQFYDASMRYGFIYPSIIIALYWGYTFIGWYYSVYIVTNERIVEIKQKGFFNRRVTEFGLDKVQNVNYHINGLQAVIFQFGDITVQTYVGDLVMKTIYHPVRIHEQMVEVIRKVVGSNVAPPVGRE